jgi:hypothetical protein
MKLKDFKKTYVFKTAESVKYFDRNDNEIQYSRDLNDKEVIDHGTMIDYTVTLEIYLDV